MPVPDVFLQNGNNASGSIVPPNSPAFVLHPRVAFHLLLRIPEEKHKEAFTFFTALEHVDEVAAPVDHEEETPLPDEQDQSTAAPAPADREEVLPSPGQQDQAAAEGAPCVSVDIGSTMPTQPPLEASYTEVVRRGTARSRSRPRDPLLGTGLEKSRPKYQVEFEVIRGQRYPRGYSNVRLDVKDSGLTDSHFHLDHICGGRLNGEHFRTLSRTVAGGPPPDLKPTPRLVGAVSCFLLNGNSHTRHHDWESLARQPNLRVCHGYHPKDVVQHDAKLRRRLVNQLLANSDLPGVCAVGEIGLDWHHTKSREGRQAQSDVFKRILERTQDEVPHLPLVLHVRGEDAYDLAVQRVCITNLQEAGVPVNRAILRHCFVGGLEEAQMWLTEFPNTKFSLGPIVVKGGGHRESALVFKYLDWDYILTETDADCLSYGGPCTPYATFAAARWLAAVKGVGLQESLRRVEGTWRDFFRQHTPEDYTL